MTMTKLLLSRKCFPAASADHVRNGDHVHIGDKLIELDPTEAAADEYAAANTYWAALAEATRRQTAIGVARKIEMPEDGPTSASPPRRATTVSARPGSPRP